MSEGSQLIPDLPHFGDFVFRIPPNYVRVVTGGFFWGGRDRHRASLVSMRCHEFSAVDRVVSPMSGRVNLVFCIRHRSSNQSFHPLSVGLKTHRRKDIAFKGSILDTVLLAHVPTLARLTGMEEGLNSQHILFGDFKTGLNQNAIYKQ